MQFLNFDLCDAGPLTRNLKDQKEKENFLNLTLCAKFWQA